jgi:membrane protease YdiL (CAAX protease family)
VRSLALLGLVIALLAITAVVSPAIAASGLVAWILAVVDSDFEFTRVYNRIFEILLVIGVLVAWRPLGLGTAAAVGLKERGWARQMGRGLAIGAGGLLIGLVVAWALGGLVPRLRYDSLEKTVAKTVMGLLGAGFVGAFEETVFRGVLLRRTSKDFGAAVGLTVTTAIYAVVHVLRGGEDVALGPTAGVERTLGLFAPLADASVLPTLLGLSGLGLVLAAARLRGGSLWLAIGIHTAWVAVFRLGRIYLHVRETPAWVVGDGWPPLIGGATGFIAVAATAALLWRALGRRRRSVALT